MKKLKNFRAVLIGTDGQVQDILCDGLQSMQKAVGGDIELLFLTKVAGGFVNESGGYGLSVNPNAGRVCERLGVRQQQPIFGPLLLVGPPSPNGNETNCREAVRRIAYEITQPLHADKGDEPRTTKGERPHGGCHSK